MFEPSKLWQASLPSGGQTGAIEVLERMRDSYNGLPGCSRLSGLDRTVLTVIEITLNHLARAS